MNDHERFMTDHEWPQHGAVSPVHFPTAAAAATTCWCSSRRASWMRRGRPPKITQLLSPAAQLSKQATTGVASLQQCNASEGVDEGLARVAALPLLTAAWSSRELLEAWLRDGARCPVRRAKQPLANACASSSGAHTIRCTCTHTGNTRELAREV